MEVARLTGLSIPTIRRYLKDGRLPKVQPGGRRCRVLIPRSAIESIGLPVAQAAKEDAWQDENTGATDSTPKSHGPLPKWMNKRNNCK